VGDSIPSCPLIVGYRTIPPHFWRRAGALVGRTGSSCSAPEKRGSGCALSWRVNGRPIGSRPALG
jgi:hypothetical protein